MQTGSPPEHRLPEHRHLVWMWPEVKPQLLTLTPHCFHTDTKNVFPLNLIYIIWVHELYESKLISNLVCPWFTLKQSTALSFGYLIKATLWSFWPRVVLMSNVEQLLFIMCLPAGAWAQAWHKYICCFLCRLLIVYVHSQLNNISATCFLTTLCQLKLILVFPPHQFLRKITSP